MSTDVQDEKLLKPPCVYPFPNLSQPLWCIGRWWDGVTTSTSFLTARQLIVTSARKKYQSCWMSCSSFLGGTEVLSSFPRRPWCSARLPVSHFKRHKCIWIVWPLPQSMAFVTELKLVLGSYAATVKCRRNISPWESMKFLQRNESYCWLIW